MRACATPSHPSSCTPARTAPRARLSRCSHEAAQEIRRIRARAQRSVVGDYIMGTVVEPLHTAKRTFKPEDTPGLRSVRGVAPVPFRLVYDLATTR